jgi:acid phosphatase (class A)
MASDQQPIEPMTRRVSRRRVEHRPERRRSPNFVGLGVAALIGVGIGAGVMLLVSPSRGPVSSGVHVSDPGAEAYSTGGAEGYLAPGAVQALQILPPPPVAGSARGDSDKQVFLATRKLENTPRWEQARADSDQSVAATLKDFSCALGADLGPASAPATQALLDRFAKDQAPVVETAKGGFRQPRPFLGAPGALCIPRSDELVRSPDYPSGHATWGWAVALILAEAAPERGGAVLARGRAYGESRVICGAHSVSAVEAGRMVGASLVSAVHASPTFRGDLESARMELASLRRSGHAPDPAMCARESALLAKPAY